MGKIIFSHSDEQKQQHDALREKLKRDYEAFIASGRQPEQVAFGVSGDKEFKGRDAGFTDLQRQRAADVRKKNGNGVAVTELQQKTLDAIDKLAAIPGVQVTKLSMRNSLRIAGGQLNDRLKSLEKKKLIVVTGSVVEMVWL